MKPPRIPSLFKLSQYNNPKNFNFQPRFYDERKERLAKREAEIKKELELDEKVGKKYEEHLRERINDSWSRKETRRLQRNSSRRLLLILAALMILLYLIYNNFDFLL